MALPGGSCPQARPSSIRPRDRKWTTHDCRRLSRSKSNLRENKIKIKKV